MVSFTEKIVDAFRKSSFSSVLEDDSALIGVAVSGGADSVSLLLGLSKVFDSSRLKVITINHNIRPYTQSMADCNYVMSLCDRLGVECTVVEFDRNQVKELCDCRKNGIEEAARFLRYKAFAEFTNEKKLFCLCVAHNQNDDLETLLMRFLAGSGIEGSTGIESERGNIFRPLLEISRNEIEMFLSENNLEYRIDSTNSDTRYLRNKIRNVLIPVLDKNFDGWKKALLSASEKNQMDEEYIKSQVQKIQWNRVSPDVVGVPLQSVVCCHAALFRRFIYAGLKLLGYGKRLPYTVINSVYSSDFTLHHKIVQYDELQFVIQNETFFIKKNQNKQTETAFLAIIEEPCKKTIIDRLSLEFEAFDDGSLVLKNKKDDKTVKLKNVILPVIVRSVQSSDGIADNCGRVRSVPKILNNWHVNPCHKNSIPVVEETGENRMLIAVAAGLFGYEDWIIKEKK